MKQEVKCTKIIDFHRILCTVDLVIYGCYGKHSSHFFIMNLDIVDDFIFFKKEDKCLRKRLELV